MICRTDAWRSHRYIGWRVDKILNKILKVLTLWGYTSLLILWIPRTQYPAITWKPIKLNLSVARPHLFSPAQTEERELKKSATFRKSLRPNLRRRRTVILQLSITHRWPILAGLQPVCLFGNAFGQSSRRVVVVVWQCRLNGVKWQVLRWRWRWRCSLLKTTRYGEFTGPRRDIAVILTIYEAFLPVHPPAARRVVGYLNFIAGPSTLRMLIAGGRTSRIGMWSLVWWALHSVANCLETRVLKRRIPNWAVARVLKYFKIKHQKFFGWSR